MSLDSIDKKLLMLLQTNAKLNTKELAHEVGLSVTPTYERIKRLERTGYIDGYIALLNKKKIDKNMTVFCLVTLKQHSKEILKEFETSIIRIPEVTECHHIAGNNDYLLKVVVSGIEAYHDFVKNKISAVSHISNVESAFAMSTLKDSNLIVL